jgi:nucleoside-diphosphate-sugar epimerase
MRKRIAVAGATGNLGGRIVRALVDCGAEVRALVRTGTGADKLAKLEQAGATPVAVNLGSVSATTAACASADCFVSAVSGLRDVIVDAQTVFLNAAIAAKVPRFIPSDFACDFTKLEDGENRNLDLRRAFHERLDEAPVAATSILNGAFADMLTRGMPLLDLSAKRVNYWGSADQRMDFTTMDNVAAFTAAAAMDPTTPKILRIAGDSITPTELAAVASEVTGSKFERVRLGGLDDLAAFIKRERAADPESEKQPYPKWQGAQYMHNMASGRAKLEPLDNNRYATMRWTTVRELLAAR